MLAPATNLKRSSRLTELFGSSERISWFEIATLLACGALATLATFFWHPSLRIPGHTILPAVFPMVAGLALAPRRWGGLVMAAGAAATGPILHWGGVGEVQPAAFVSVLALGPLLDFATLGEPVGWRLYARFIAAGVVANLFAFALKFGMTAFG
jgi:hypothetical protein